MTAWTTRLLCIAVLLASCSALSAADPRDGQSPRRVILVDSVLADDGDDDGWADTNETVTLRIRVLNATGSPLEGAFARLTTDDPRIACITRPVVVLGHLAPDELRLTDAGFEFRVADVDRPSVNQPFTARFVVRIGYDGLPIALEQEEVLILDLDLDLDAAGEATPTAFFEGFEDGLGAFAPMPLDEDLNAPDDDLSNDSAGYLNSDGYRCQYNDPDFQRIACTDCNYNPNCFANPNDAPDTFYFQQTFDRAFTGEAALYFGVPLDSLRGFTTPSGQLEAVVTTEPLQLDFRRRCSTGADVCTSDLDCPPGEICEVPWPVLTFKQQVDFIDHRTVNRIETEGVDRGVVQVQATDGNGDPAGPWQTLEAFANPYATQPQTLYTSCSFDPVDDGNDEDDYFFPEIPARRFGPSSTCFPQHTYVHQGDTDGAFDPLEIGDARDGPGLQGQAGTGTWIEARFSLARFRGQRVRLRFLATTLKLGRLPDWESAFLFNPSPGDDGWFLDDVSVTRTLTTPTALVVDAKPNVDLPGLFDHDADEVTCDNCVDDANAGQSDADGDGIGDVCDTCPFDGLDDADGDGLCCTEDNCCSVDNPAQADADGDGVGDACDNCGETFNPDQADDVHPGGPGDACDDPDGDGVVDQDDSCPDLADAEQADDDGDGLGNPCDNCPFHWNADQEDVDGDGAGNVCDACPIDPATVDSDGDGVADGCDVCPLVADAGQIDTDLDGHGDACDNCPLLANVDQSDVDGDLTGDECDRCLDGDAADPDDDRLPCSSDNCPLIANADQSDDDADGVGNPCDICPTDPLDDADGDGRCARADNCPTRYNPDQTTAVDLMRPQIEQAGTLYWHISPDGRHVVFDVYRPDLDVREMYGVRIDGSERIRLHGELPANARINHYAVSAVSGAVIALADLYAANERQVISVPIEGGKPQRISPGGTLERIVFSRDGDRALLSSVGADGILRLVSAKPSGGAPTVLAERPTGDATPFLAGVSPDGSTVVYVADENRDGVPEMYATPIDGGPRSSLLDTRFRAGTNIGYLTPDRAHVAFVADPDVPFRSELHTVPRGGGLAERRNAPLQPGSDVVDLMIDPSGQHVVFRVDTNEGFPFTKRRMLFTTPVTGGAATLLGGSDVAAYAITPDGQWVVFRRNSPDSLLVAPIEGGTATTLRVPDEDYLDLGRFEISPDGSRVVYLEEVRVGLDNVVDLFSVPIDGGPPVKLTPPLLESIDVRDFLIAPDGPVIYQQGAVYRVPVDGGDAVELVALPFGVGEFAVTGDGRNLVLHADAYGDHQLFAVAVDPDPDGDGILAQCDVCADVANADQIDADGDGYGAACDCADDDHAVFPGAFEVNDGKDNQCPGDPGYGSIDETSGVASLDRQDGATVYGWPAQPGAERYEVARATAADYSVGCSIVEVDGTSFVDAVVPAPNAVVYYLTRAAFPFPGSWGRSSDGIERLPDGCPASGGG